MPASPIPAARRGLRYILCGNSQINRSMFTRAADGTFLCHTLARAAGMPDPLQQVHRSTMQGGTARMRWEAGPADFTAPYNEDVKVTIESYHVVTNTETFREDRVPTPADATPEEEAAMAESLDYLSRFVTLAREEGAGGEGAEAWLFSGWPAVDGSMGPFREGLVRSESLWDWLQDGIAANTGYRPQMIRGHRLMLRLNDDTEAGLVPGVRHITGLFADRIHTNPTGAYPVACLHHRHLYGVSPVGLPRAGVTRAQAAYFQQTALEVAMEAA